MNPDLYAKALDFWRKVLHLQSHTGQQYRGVEQLVARWAHNPKVAGSSPASATTT